MNPYLPGTVGFLIAFLFGVYPSRAPAHVRIVGGIALGVIAAALLTLVAP